MGTIGGCAEVCTPILFTDYEACAEICASAGAQIGASAEVKGGKEKANVKAGLWSVGAGVAIRKRESGPKPMLLNEEPSYYKGPNLSHVTFVPNLPRSRP